MSSPAKSFVVNKGFYPHIIRNIIVRHWYFPVLSTGLFYVISFFYLRYTKAVYESNSVIQIVDKDQTAEIIGVANANANNDISAEIQFLSSPFLFEKALAKLDLRVSLFSEGKILTEDLYRKSSFKVLPQKLLDSSLCNVPITIKFEEGSLISLNYQFSGKKFVKFGRINTPISTPHFEIIIQTPDFNKVYFLFNKRQSLVASLIPSLVVAPLDPNAKTISVAYSGHNPIFCHDIVEAITNSFFDYDEEIRTQGADNSVVFIDKQLDSLTAEIKKAEDSILFYQKMNKMISSESKELDILNTLENRRKDIKRLKEDLGNLNVQISMINNEPNRVELYKKKPDLNSETFNILIDKNTEQLQQLLSKREELLYTFTEQTREIKQINKKIKSTLSAIRNSYRLVKNELSDSINIIQDNVNKLEGESNNFPKIKERFKRLESLIEVSEKYYKMYEEKKFTYAISNAGYVNENRILSAPTNPTEPFSPNNRIIYLSFIGVGLIIGLAFLAFKYLTFNEINNLEELKSLLPQSINILGGVPLTKQSTLQNQCWQKPSEI
jgi:tyrosine-protein kinase Etk/Wzc